MAEKSYACGVACAHVSFPAYFTQCSSKAHALSDSHFASHGVSKGVYFVRGDIVEGAICITTVATCVLVGGVL